MPSRSSSIACWLLPLVNYAFTAAINSAQLLQVQIIISHADRVPMLEFTSPMAINLFFRGLGQLSSEGLLRASLQGAAFKRRYMQLGLLLEQTNGSEVFVRSSPHKRNLMSATAFSAAFIGDIEPDENVIRIHTTQNEKEEKVLNIHNSLEHRCEVLDRYNISGSPFCLLAPLIARFVQEYPDCAAYSYAKIEAAIAEVENSETAMDSELEKCARGSARMIQFKALGIRSGISDDVDLSRVRASIGPRMSIVSRNVDDFVKNDLIKGNTICPLVRIYCADGDVLLAAARALGIIGEYGGRSPVFSSAIIIETWSSSEGFDVKIVLKNGLHNSFTAVANYTFIEFKKQIRPYSAPDPTDVQWDENVTNSYEYVQFERDAERSNVSSNDPRIYEEITVPYKHIALRIPLREIREISANPYEQLDELELSRKSQKHHTSVLLCIWKILLVTLIILIVARLFQLRNKEYSRIY